MIRCRDFESTLHDMPGKYREIPPAYVTDDQGFWREEDWRILAYTKENKDKMNFKNTRQ